MKTDDKLSIKIIRRIAFVSIIFLGILTVGVMATKSDLETIKIVFADDCETTVMSSQTNVLDILLENHIILEADEEVYPDLESDIDFTKTITISKRTSEKKIIAEEIADVTTEELLGNYVTITEKIITEQIEIPFETVTKDISSSNTETTNKVLQEGENGLKEIKYKAKFQNDVEIEREMISETVIKEPVEKIIQISTKVTSRSGSRASSASASASAEGKEPTVVTLNTTAYCAASCGGNTRTSSGAIASSWYTVAAGSAYPAGTVMYIPYFANKPNGGWFVVQDTGGAISNSRLDIWMDSLGECLMFGRKNLECYVYK